MKFVPLPKGTFYMSWYNMVSTGEKGSAKKTEIKEDFEIAIYTVTQGQWQELMGKNPRHFSRDGIWKSVKDAKQRDSITVDFEKVKGSKTGELSANFVVVLGVTPAE